MLVLFAALPLVSEETTCSELPQSDGTRRHCTRKVEKPTRHKERKICPRDDSELVRINRTLRNASITINSRIEATLPSHHQYKCTSSTYPKLAHFHSPRCRAVVDHFCFLSPQRFCSTHHRWVTHVLEQTIQ